MLVFPMSEGTQVGDARRQVIRLAQRTGLDETDTGRVALIATELATNLLKHASEDRVLLAQARDPSFGPGIEMLALDRGPGMPDLARAQQDGYSTAGSPGTGFGAVSRLSDLIDIHSAPHTGTAILSRIMPSRAIGAPEALPLGALSIPKPGEDVCGDAWAARRHRDGQSIMVVDGLGHGASAAEAAREAVRAFGEDRERSPAEALERIHEALRGTRGAAVAVARIDMPASRLHFAGVGNIAGNILSTGRSHGLVSHNGTAGAEIRKIQEFTYDWPADALLVLHSDGLVSRWSLDPYQGLRARHPSLIAGVLYRDFTRGRDDVTVAVVRASGLASHSNRTFGGT